MRRIGFDNSKYIKLQSQNILERISQFGGKLYLEFGGKLFDDFHASRVLPGFEPDSKVRMLSEMKDEAEIIVVISADDIERSKRRGDLGITYDLDVFRLIEAFRDSGLYVGSVVITRYRDQNAAKIFAKKLDSLGITYYKHYEIQDYPANLPLIVSADGFGKNEYIQTSRQLIVVTSSGPGSGKMATCLSQLYHEYKLGNLAGYAKFETFPIWNLPLQHPVNVAYESATSDLADMNMIDHFHLEAYGERTVNYNRDIEIFPVVSAILSRILGESPYKSPTDMGVNMAGFCITDDDAVQDAAKQEVIRRFYATAREARRGTAEPVEVQRQELLMNQLNVSPADRPVVAAALKRSAETCDTAVALELPDGLIVTGKTSELLGAASACLLNALKALAGIDNEVLLISPEVIEPIQQLKVTHMGNRNPRLHTDELLIALAISAVSDNKSALAIAQLENLAYCEAHSTVILTSVDENVFQRLKVNMTYEPKFQAQKLYQK